MKTKLLASVLTLFLSLVAPQARALTCYAVDSTKLYTFDHTTPGMASDVTITGLGGYAPVGLAMRTTVQTLNPANPGVGSLWLIAANGTDFKLFVVNPATGAATQIGNALVMDDSAGADAFGFGFDPATDRFRFISVQFNYQINPNNVTVQQQTSFPGFPAHNGAAFSTASFGGTNQFYNVSRDVVPRRLQTSTNIAAGTLSFVGPAMPGLGAGVQQPMGMDIAGSLFLLTNGSDKKLYSVDRTNGTMAEIGAIQGMPDIRGLAIRPASFPKKLPVKVKVKGKKRIVTTSTKVVIKGTATSEAGISKVEFRIGKGKFKKAKGTKKWKVKIKPKVGTTKVEVRAIGGNDIESKSAKVKVIRQ